MKIATDKRMHLIGGLLAVAAIVGAYLLALFAGLWVACGVGGTAIAWGWEWVQKIRGEGVPDAADAWHGTIASWAGAAFVFWIEAAGFLPVP